MELIDENVSKQKKGNKGANILLVIIGLLVILCIIIVYLIINLKNSIRIITVDEVSNPKFEKILIFDDENTNIYMPIRNLAEILGYQSYNGEYLNASEDSNKCYVQSEDEVVNISLKSNKIVKRDLNNKENIEKITLKEPIKEIEGVLYTDIDGASKIFNLQFNYDGKDVEVYTLNYLIEYYTTQMKEMGYESLKEGIENQKAIFDGIIIAKSTNGKYGVINISDGKTILESKYDDIEYLKTTREFLVTSNGNKGIITLDKETKISVEYSEIIKINEDLYRVKKDGSIGIIDSSGKTIINPKYDYIGLENNDYEEIENDYIMLDNIIPVKKENKWAIYDTDGKQITQFIFDGFGCDISRQNKEKKSIIFIDNYDIFVAQLNKKYYLVNKKGENAIEFGFDDVYVINNDGEKEYHATFNNEKDANILELLEKLGIEKAEN